MKSHYLLIILILIVACNQNTGVIEEEIFPKVIPAVYDSISTHLDLPDGKEILINPVDDHLDSVAVVMALNSIGNEESEDYVMISKLGEVLNQQVKYDFSSISKDCQFKLISNPETIQKYEYGKGLMIGSSTISPVIMDKENKDGVFYIDLQCGRSCGRGYFVFVNQKSGNWAIDRLINIWN